MQAKALEIRDDGTFIPALAVDMNPSAPNGPYSPNAEILRAQQYLLRRCGYACDGRPNILVTHLDGNGSPATNDPYHWGGRTWPVAHDYIIKNWDRLKDGDVVDVEFILGETKAPKVSERMAVSP
jgi:hypothetical protein